MNIELLGERDTERVLAASHLFDSPAEEQATNRFLADSGHHLLIAYEGERAIGFVSGVETTHPDKGTEMFLYELAVEEAFRGRGVGKALVERLAELATDRGCYGMWVLTDEDNAAGKATYGSAGGSRESTQVMYSWAF